MKQIFFSVVSASILSSASVTAAEIVPGKYAKLFKGDQGIELALVPLEGEGAKRFLGRINGVESKVDDKVLLFVEEPAGKTSTLTTYVNDRKSHLIHFRESHWSGGVTKVSVFLPESPTKEVRVWFDEKLSKALVPAELVKLHKSQLKDGSILKVQTSNEKEWKAHVNREFKRAVDDAEGPCGGGISARIDWAKVKPELMGKIPLATMCRQPAEALQLRCAGDGQPQLAKKISGITCQVGDTQSLAMSDKRLIWTVTPSGHVDLAAMQNQLNKLVK